jgi:hypothetical protein
MKTLLYISLLAGLVAPAPAKVDITGKWNCSVEAPGRSGSPKFDFKQDGEKLTGTFEGLLGRANLTGTVKDNKIEFKFTVRIVGEVTYSGEILDGTMKGKVKYGDVAGTFTAKRAEK